MQHDFPRNATDVAHATGRDQYNLAPASLHELPEIEPDIELRIWIQSWPSPSLVTNDGYRAKNALLFTCSWRFWIQFFLLRDVEKPVFTAIYP